MREELEGFLFLLHKFVIEFKYYKCYHRQQYYLNFTDGVILWGESTRLKRVVCF